MSKQMEMFPFKELIGGKNEMVITQGRRAEMILEVSISNWLQAAVTLLRNVEGLAMGSDNKELYKSVNMLANGVQALGIDVMRDICLESQALNSPQAVE